MIRKIPLIPSRLENKLPATKKRHLRIVLQIFFTENNRTKVRIKVLFSFQQTIKSIQKQEPNTNYNTIVIKEGVEIKVIHKGTNTPVVP
jgi:hypothetical protein